MTININQLAHNRISRYRCRVCEEPMRIRFFALLFFVVAAAMAQDRPADLVLKNANIYTVDEHNPHVQAVAVRGDRIFFAGSDAEVQKYIGPNTRVRDLKGAT